MSRFIVLTSSDDYCRLVL